MYISPVLKLIQIRQGLLIPFMTTLSLPESHLSQLLKLGSNISSSVILSILFSEEIFILIYGHTLPILRDWTYKGISVFNNSLNKPIIYGYCLCFRFSHLKVLHLLWWQKSKIYMVSRNSGEEEYIYIYIYRHSLYKGGIWAYINTYSCSKKNLIIFVLQKLLTTVSIMQCS